MRDFLIDFANDNNLPMTSADFAMRRRERILRAFELAVERGAAPRGMKLAEFRRFYRRHAVVFRTNVRAGLQYQPSGPIPKFLLLKAEDSDTEHARSYPELDRNCLGNGPPDHSGKSLYHTAIAERRDCRTTHHPVFRRRCNHSQIDLPTPANINQFNR